jgi:alkylation response protein AidB-like acyl-CoA dehydrogenase
VPEALDEEHRALRARALEFVAAMRAQPLDDEGRMGPDAARALIAEARRLGLHGMTQPKAFGGSEAGALALTVVRETLAAANSPGARHAFGPGPGVLAGAEGVLKTHYLEPMLRGEKRAAFAFTEARDAPRHTQARSDGEFLVVDGEKAYVTS